MTRILLMICLTFFMGLSLPATHAIDEADAPMPFGVGIQLQTSPDIFDLWARIARRNLHMDWAKLEVNWSEIERTPERFDWNEMDFTIPNIAEYDLNLLVTLVGTPPWAREEGTNPAFDGPPADADHFGRFVEALLRRYPGMIHGLEVWNEMNFERQWASVDGLNAGRYIDLVRAAHNAARSAAPGVMIISGGMAPTDFNDGQTAWDDLVYLEQLIEGGLLDVVDCVGLRHYGINIAPDLRWDELPNNPDVIYRAPFDSPHRSWSFRSTFESYAEAISTAQSTIPLCVTRFGWASAEDLEGAPPGLEFAFDNTLQQQRDWTIQALDYMAESGLARLAIVWNLNYGPQAGWNPDNATVPYSLIGPDTSFRPVFDALAACQTARNR